MEPESFITAFTKVNIYHFTQHNLYGLILKNRYTEKKERGERERERFHITEVLYF